MASDKTMLTQTEKECLMHLADAWNAFAQLQNVLPCDQQEFMQAIHRAQSIIAVRVAQRLEPDVWTSGKAGM